MKILLLSLTFSFNVFANYKESQCYQSFVQAIKKQDIRYKEQLRNKQNALINQSFLYHLIKPEKNNDYRRWVLDILKTPYGNEHSDKIFSYIGDPLKKKYTMEQIQAAIKAGFKSEEYCGFLKGFGAVKRFVKNYLTKDLKYTGKVNDTERSDTNKDQVFSTKEPINNIFKD